MMIVIVIMQLKGDADNKDDGDADNNFEDGDMISMLMMLCWQHKLSYIIFTIYKVDTSISLHNFHSVLLLIDFML